MGIKSVLIRVSTTLKSYYLLWWKIPVLSGVNIEKNAKPSDDLSHFLTRTRKSWQVSHTQTLIVLLKVNNINLLKLQSCYECKNKQWTFSIPFLSLKAIFIKKYLINTGKIFEQETWSLVIKNRFRIKIVVV